MQKSTNCVFFDTDCLSSFLKIDREDIFLKLIKGKIVIPDNVYSELLQHDKLSEKIDKLLQEEKVETMSLYLDDMTFNYYQEMTSPKSKKIIGAGEAEAIALCKANNGILASNNIRDVSFYVKKYEIKHVTTADILYEAIQEGIINSEEANAIWKQMINKRIMLPSQSFDDYFDNQTSL